MARENAESLVVRHKAQPAELSIGLPADVAVSHTKAQSRRPEAKHSDNAFVFESDVTDDLADEVVAKPVVLIEESVEAGNLVTARWAYDETPKVLRGVCFHPLTYIRPL